MLISSGLANRSALRPWSGEGRPAAIFDRDGVLNVDRGYVHMIEDFEWIPGAKEAVRFLNRQNFTVIVATNQSGIARGYYRIEDVQALHEWMGRELLSVGARIDGFYFCPTHPEGSVQRYRRNSNFRKPAPGMILQAIEDWRIDRSRSFLIGDKQHDLEAAAAAGVQGYLFDGADLFALVTQCVASLAGATDAEAQRRSDFICTPRD